jgi:hypothetical protein
VILDERTRYRGQKDPYLAGLSLDERLTRVTEQRARVLEQIRICKRNGQLINVRNWPAGAELSR